MKNSAIDLALLIARVPIGVYFWLAGYNKIAGPGVSAFVSSNADNAAQFMGMTLGKAYLGALPFVELLVGLLLIAGLFVRPAAIVATLMLISFLMATGGPKLNMARVIDSGGGEPFAKNIIYISLTLALAIIGGGRIATTFKLRKRPAAPAKQ